MPVLDIVIPCYNYGQYLPACVRSALEQPGVEVRVLVIDDCSTDDSLAVARSLAAADPRVEVVHHAVNRGHIATYNEGLIDWSSGDYVVLLSADDLLAPGALQRACDVMEANPKVGLVYGWAPYFERNDDLPDPRLTRRGVRRWDGIDWIAGRCRDGHNVISSPEVVLRRSVQQQVGGYRPQFPHAGDLEMWLRVAAVSDVAYIEGVPQAYYRVHTSSMQRTIYNTNVIDLVQRRDVFDRFFDEHPHLPEARALHARARLALAREALVGACRAIEHGDAAGADELEDMASSLSPNASRTSPAVGLRWRRLLGSTWCQRSRLYVPAAAMRRAKSIYRRERWKRHGE
ncbi:MAG: glycosyltransferase family 2 protein [Acidimicrobiales bacterium]